MTDVSNLSDTIIPKSDQLNSDQLLGGPITITVSSVKRAESDQPIAIHYTGDKGKPYKPCKSMRKVLIFAWGDDGREWAGRSMVLYNNPEVKFGGIKVGGIRISHLTHIERDLTIPLTETKGKKTPHLIKKLVIQESTDPKDGLKVAIECGLEAFKAAWNALTPAQRKALGTEYRDECAKQAEAWDKKRAEAVITNPALDGLNNLVSGQDTTIF